MLRSFRLAAARRRTADSLAIGIVGRARAAVFYEGLGVADSFNGRFDLVALHAFLVLERLEAEGESALAQDLVNALFHSFEDALREQGAGDMGMSKRLQKIAGAFYGRLEAYRAAAAPQALAAALLRNLYGEEPARAAAAAVLADYMTAVRTRLAGLDRGEADFGPLPEARA